MKKFILSAEGIKNQKLKTKGTMSVQVKSRLLYHKPVPEGFKSHKIGMMNNIGFS